MKTKQQKKMGTKILSYLTALLLVLGVFSPGPAVAQAESVRTASEEFSAEEVANSEEVYSEADVASDTTDEPMAIDSVNAMAQSETDEAETASAFSTAAIFPQLPKSYEKSFPLDADLRLGEDKGEQVITVEKLANMDFVGVLFVKDIKQQIADVKTEMDGLAGPFGPLNPNEVKLSEVTNEFIATLTLPDELSFAGPLEGELSGGNDVFKITGSSVSGQTLTVKFGLAAPENIKNFAQLQEAVDNADDALKITYKTAIFNDGAQSETDYEAIGTVTGEFTAKATFKGVSIPFKFDWTAKQADEGASASNPDDIALSVKYEMQDKEDNLLGDMLVNGNTQHDKVYEAQKADYLTLTGLLDVSPIKKRIKAIEDQFVGDDAVANVSIEDVQTSFEATMTLPEELQFADDYTVELTGTNGKFKILNQKVEGKRITVTMTVADGIDTFQKVKEAVESVENNLQLHVKGVQFVSDKAMADTNYTVFGTVTGEFMAVVKNALGSKKDLHYRWSAVQMPEGADSEALDSEDIRLTLKYIEEKVPSEPQEESSTTTTTTTTTTNTTKPSSAPKTGDTTNIALYATLLVLAVVGVAVVAKNRKKSSNK